MMQRIDGENSPSEVRNYSKEPLLRLCLIHLLIVDSFIKTWKIYIAAKLVN